MSNRRVDVVCVTEYRKRYQVFTSNGPFTQAQFKAFLESAGTEMGLSPRQLRRIASHSFTNEKWMRDHSIYTTVEDFDALAELTLGADHECFPISRSGPSEGEGLPPGEQESVDSSRYF